MPGGKRLTARFVETAKRPGRYTDGPGGLGLSLRVQARASGGVAKNWSQRIRIAGRYRYLGLGSYPVITLKMARDRALRNARTVAEGGDPMRPPTPTLAEALEEVLALRRPTWKAGASTEKIWRSAFQYVLPALGQKPVDRITTGDLMECLNPIWATKAATAGKLRSMLSLLFRWSVGAGHRPDDPAGERLLAALPPQPSGRKHLAALPHSEVAAALVKVRESSSTGAVRLAIEFVALTATRHGEARGATWSEIDLGAHLWTIPGERMKSGREHRVPLSPRAVEVLASARALSDGSGLVFPMKGKPIAGSTLRATFKRLGIEGTPHGLRSSFRDWCGESGVAREVAESCLAHQVGNAVELAYARSDLLERRREVMEAWGAYLV